MLIKMPNIDFIIIFMAYKMKQKEIIIPTNVNKSYNHEESTDFEQDENTPSTKQKKAVSKTGKSPTKSSARMVAI